MTGERGSHNKAGQSGTRPSALSIAVKNFAPLWFTASMDTGILSIIMSILPWQFRGLGVLSTIMFVWNLVLFVSFTLVSIARLVKYPRHVRSETLDSAEELSYLAAPAIAYLTLVAQVSLTCSTAWGYGLTVFAYVLWWMGLVWTVLVCSGTVVLLSRRNVMEDRQLPPAVFLPVISLMTQGTTGGIIVNYSARMTATLAIPVMINSFLCIGYGLFLGILYYGIYLHRLLAAGPPVMEKLPSIMLTVGPLGQFATAIQLLGRAAYTGGFFAQYNQGTFLTSSAASSLSTTCTLLALLLVGSGFLWVTLAWYLVIESIVKGDLTFTLTWWSLIFPMGVYTTALINLSIALDSPGFRGLSAALLILLFMIYFFNLFFTVYRIWTGVALGVPRDRELEKAKERKEREEQNNAHYEPSGGGYNV